MPSSKGRQLYETVKDPHLLSGLDLFEMSLSRISKGLSLTTPQPTTLEVYFRWLEVHRTRPSPATKQWENTVWQWSQSLRARGILKQDLVHEIRDWKDKYGPFRAVEGRHPPEIYEIEKAFSDPMNDKSRARDQDFWFETRGKREDSGGRKMIDGPLPSKRERHESGDPRSMLDQPLSLRRERDKSRDPRSMLDRALPSRSDRNERARPREELRLMLDRPLPSKPESDESPYQRDRSRPQLKNKQTLENFKNPPPSSYTCNRCGVKGHHLQVCPTNMDPSFDKPPDSNYLCSICDATGEHYKSLCPRNPDPYSIIQRRAVQGLQTSLKVLPSHRRDDYHQEELVRIQLNDRKNTRQSREHDSSRGRTHSRTPTSAEKFQEIQRIEEIQYRLRREEMAEFSQGGYAGRPVVEDIKNGSRKRALSGSTDQGSPTSTMHLDRKKTRRIDQVKEAPGLKAKDSQPRLMADGGYAIREDEKGASSWPGTKSSPPLSLHSASSPYSKRNRIREALGCEVDSKREGTRDKNKDVEDLIKIPILEAEAAEECGYILFRYSNSDETRQDEGSGDFMIGNTNPDEISLSSDDDSRPENLQDTRQNTPGVPKAECSALTTVPIEDIFDCSSDESDDADSNEEKNGSTTSTAEKLTEKYSEFIQRLMTKHEEMKQVVNKVKKRPSAVTIWKRTNASRSQLTSTVALASPNLVAETETSPSTLDQFSDYEAHEISAIEVVKRLDEAGFVEHEERSPVAQTDGTYDEHPPKSVERSKDSGPRKNKLSGFGKGAFGKVKNVVARDFPILSLRGRSRTRHITNQTEPFSRSPTPPSPCPKDDVRSPLALKSTNIPRVLITSLPAQQYDKDLPQIPSSKRVSHEPGPSTASLPVCGHHMSNQKDNRPRLQSSATLSVRNISRYSALPVSRSTNEFRSTVRRIIQESKVDDHPSQSADSLILNKPKTVRPRIVRSISAAPGIKKMTDLREPAEVAAGIKQMHKAKQQQVEIARARISSDNDNDRKARLENLKQFSNSFRLATAKPANLDFLKIAGSTRKSVDDDATSFSERRTSICNADAKVEQHVRFGKTPTVPSSSRDNSLEGLRMFGDSLKWRTPVPADIQSTLDHRSVSANKTVTPPNYKAPMAG